MKFIYALLSVLTLDLLLGISQISVDKVAEIEGFSGNNFYNKDGDLIHTALDDDYNVNPDYQNDLPETEGSVSTETGNFFTDLFGTIKNWFLDNTGVKYASRVINAVPNVLKNLGMPLEIAGLLGAFWHLFTVFLIIMAIRGGN